MSERDLRGTWKLSGRDVPTPSSPIIGMVYRGNSIDGVGNVIGMLQIYDTQKALLRDRDGVMHLVEVKSLQALYDDD